VRSEVPLEYISVDNYRIIDVSQWMDDFRFPGDPEFTVTGPFNRVSGDNPEFVYDLGLCTQTGTHIQGPHYFLESGTKIHEFPLSSFEGKALIVDLFKRGRDTTREDLASFLDGKDLAGKIVIFRTGNMEEIIEKGVVDPADRPGLATDAAKYLVETMKVKMIAIDSIGVESRESKHFEVSKYLCSQGVLLLEGLVNLYAVSKREVFLEAFPLKIRGVEGSPCRAIIKEKVYRYLVTTQVQSAAKTGKRVPR